MSAAENGAERIKFAHFEFDPQSGELRCNGEPLRIQPQPLRVLRLLLERAGKTISRQELRDYVWGDATYVEFDQGLNYCIRQIRIALGDNAADPKYVETLPKQGYRFLPDVIRSPGNDQNHPPTASEEERFAPLVSAVRKNMRTQWRTITVTVALCVLFLVTGAWLYRASESQISSLAVLPLNNLSGDPSQGLLRGRSDGRADHHAR